MNKWLITASIVIGLAGLAASAAWWLPPLLAFVGANSDLIQGLTDLTQLVLWVGAGLAAVVGLWRGQKKAHPERAGIRLKATVNGSGASAQGEKAQAVGERGIGTRDFQGIAISGDQNFMILQVAEAFWQQFPSPSLSVEGLRQATERYLTYLVDRYRYLEFKGMGVSDRVSLRLPLVEMYVPLKARIELPEGETWARELRLSGRQVSAEEAETIGHRLSEPQPALDLLRQHDGLIILGDPGAGKTTFLKYLALRLASGEGEALGLGVRLPILLPLSAYANALATPRRDVPLDQFIAEYYHARGIDLPIGSMLTEALARGGALLLLDGLDEVQDLAQRHLVVSRVMDCFAFHRQPGNKFILTSRVVGYREVRPTAEGLAECTLVDFEDEDIAQFVDRWTGALERAARGDTPVAAQEAAREREELLAAVQRNPGVRRLAANPLLLTILALMKRQGVMLPERRVQLYQNYVETLLKQWNLVRGLDRPPSRDLDVMETTRVLAPLALWMQETSPGKGLVKREDVWQKLEEIYSSRDIPDPEQAARQLLADAGEYAGLLLEQGPGEYGFIHLTFQEYLAAVAIAQRGQREVEPVVKALAAHVGDDNWHEVALLTIGYMGIVQGRDEAAGATLQELIQAAPGEPGQAVVLAGEAVLDAWPGGVTPACKAAVVQALRETLVDDARVKPPVRAAAGDSLAKLPSPAPQSGAGGDPRFRADAWYLPDEPLLGFVNVPAGPFWMGEDEDAHLNERLDYDYWIARYPVTAAQFQAFVSVGGYQEARYWPEAKAAKVWQSGQVKGRADNEPRDKPADYGEPFNLPNHPAVGVTWYEALAFCRWLTEQLRESANQQIGKSGKGGEATHQGETPFWEGLAAGRWQVRLPSEAEWEKAARGGIEIQNLKSQISNPNPQRRYPWGDEPDPNRANYSDTGIGATSAVGCFPGGVSPYGVQDMAGNVWEWTASEWTPGSSSRVVRRVVRGGSWRDLRDLARCTFRGRRYPNHLWRYHGFRVVVSPISPLSAL